MANDAMNSTPNSKAIDGQTPIQAMERSKTHMNAKHWHPFGCPVYALNQALQICNIHHKWKPRARPGIYLGRLSQHARSVALVLNIHTGVKMDRSFQTVGKVYNEESPTVKWIKECGFLNNKEKQDKSAGATKQKQPVNRPEDLVNIPSLDTDQIQDHLNLNLPPPEGGGLIPTNEAAVKPPLRRSSRQTREPEWFK